MYALGQALGAPGGSSAVAQAAEVVGRLAAADSHGTGV